MFMAKICHNKNHVSNIEFMECLDLKVINVKTQQINYLLKSDNNYLNEPCIIIRNIIWNIIAIEIFYKKYHLSYVATK